MKSLDFPIGLSCKNSQEFMNLCAIQFIHDMGINSSDIRLLYNPESHTAYLEFHIHYRRDRPFSIILKPKHINGTMRLILDNGWDCIKIELQDLSEKDVQDYFSVLNSFIVQVKSTYPDMFGEFNPSERD